MKINTSTTRGKYPLSSRKILKKTLVAAIWWGILTLVLIIAAYWAAGQPQPPLNLSTATLHNIAKLLIALYPLVVLLSFFYQRWYYATYYYDLQANYVTIRKNPITPHEITIPYERLQDVYVDQDLLDRMLRLFDVHISSATASSTMEAHIDGVGQQAADGLRNDLLHIIKKKIG